MPQEQLFFTSAPSPSGEQTEIEFVNKLRQLYTDAKRSKERLYEKWYRNYRLVNNVQSGTGTSWVPSPRDSEIYPTISALVGWMTDQNTVIDCIPAADPYSSYYNFISDLSNDLAEIIYSTWLVEDYQAQIKLVLWDAFMYGTGIFKNVWDGSLDGGYGNAVIRRVDPYTFYPDPNATSMDDMEYCVEVRRMSYNECERRFPNSAAILEIGAGDDDASLPQRPTMGGLANSDRPTDTISTNGVTLSLSKRRGGDITRSTTIPSIIVYEFWLRENSIEEEDYDDLPEEDRPALAEAHCSTKWRVVCVANGRILLDEYAEDLWSHGQHPYERYVFDDIGEFYGIALVDHLAYPQMYINRLLSAMQYNTELTGNPVFLDPTNSGLQRVGIVNKPGQRLPVSPNAMNAGKGPGWMPPPTMSPEVMKLVEFWISRIENTSGLSAIVRGATPTSRNSQGVISSIQEAAFVRIRAGLRNLEKALEKCTIKIGDLMVDNYTEPRIMAIVGPGGEKTAKVLQARHFYGPSKKGASPLKFMIQIKAGASAPTSRQARTAEADTLYAMGALDRRSLLEAHQTPHIDQILQRIADDMQKGMFSPPGARQRTGRTS